MDIYKELNIIMIESDINIEREFDELCFSNSLIYLETSENNKTIINRIIYTFKSFINKCIETIKEIYNKITLKIDEWVIQHKLNKLSNFSKIVEDAKKSGKTSFICIDIDKVVSLLKEESKVYKKEINKFCYNYINYYRTSDQAENHALKIQKIMDKYSTELTNLLNSPKTYNINEAEKIVTKLTKDKEYLKVLNNYTFEIKEIEKYVTNILKSVNKYNEENNLTNLNGVQACISKSILNIRNHTFDIVKVGLHYLNYIFIIVNVSKASINVGNDILNNTENIENLSFQEINGLVTNSLKNANITNPAPLIGANVVVNNIDNIYGKQKMTNRIDDISKIYSQPSLRFK